MDSGIRKRVCRAVASREVDRWEVLLLGGVVVLGLAIRIVFLVATRNHVLVGDEPVYASYGENAVQGRWFWAETMGQSSHPSMWKPPGYPLFVMLGYSLLGADPDRMLLLQVLVLAPLTILLVWLLARDLFGSTAGIVAAAVAATYPGTWQFEVRLFSEGLAAVLALVVVLLVLGRGRPSPARVALVGLAMAANLYVRPTAVYLFVLVFVAWWVAMGLRSAVVRVAAAFGLALLLILPWTIRNATLEDSGFVLLSVQDAAVYGTFNEDSASSPTHPYAWQPSPPSLMPTLLPLLATESEFRVRQAAQELAVEYIKAHPESVPSAIFWNGLSRLWDIRDPSIALTETQHQGRERGVAIVHLTMYYPILALVVLGLWRWRRNLAIVLPLLALVPTMAVVFSIDAGTRYRAPTEPLLVVLASGAALGARPRLTRDEPAEQDTVTSDPPGLPGLS